MKKINIKYFALVALSIVLNSCTLLDDLVDAPKDSTIAVLSTVDECDLVMNGLNQVETEFSYALADNYEFRDIENMWGVWNNTLSSIFYIYSLEFTKNDKSKEGITDGTLWNLHYQDIWKVNVVLENIDDVKGDNQLLRNQIKGEAYLARAYQHYSLVKNYGIAYNKNASTNLGVPLSLSFDSAAKLPRSTVAEVYAQVIKDIESALEYMNVKYRDPAVTYRGSILSAKTLLMQVYLDMAVADASYYQKVIELGEEVLSVNSFLYNLNNSDDLSESMGMAFYNREMIQTRLMLSYESYYLFNFNTSSSLFPSLLFTNEATPTADDLRRNRLYTDNDKTLGRYTYSFNGMFASGSPRMVLGLTTPAVYFDLMEAYFRTGDISNATRLYNEFAATRYSNYSDKSTVTLDEIKHERRMEFLGTGRRFFSIKRYNALGEYNKEIIRYTKDGRELGKIHDETDFRFPIPLDVIRLNPNITQNIYN